MKKPHPTTSRFRAVMAAGLAFAATIGTFAADPLKLDATATKGTLPAGQQTVTHVRIGLTGSPQTVQEKRPPLNLALVLDRSGSMAGEKLARAREAAQVAVRALRDDDIVSVVTYENGVQVLVPATKATAREDICRQIASIQHGGGTALFAGVARGAEELRKFLARDRVNRVLLLSDGLANVGPQTPGELGEFGASLIKEGISVTTVGLGSGYNEDLMTQLAGRSDGRHAFINDSDALVTFFREEMGAMQSVVAQQLTITISCDPGVKPLRVLGREASVVDGRVTLTLNQLFAAEQKYIILELQVPATAAGSARDLVHAEVTARALPGGEAFTARAGVSARFSDNPAEVEQSIDKKAMADAVAQIATEENVRAMLLRDRGDIEGAKKALLGNTLYLEKNAAALGSAELSRIGSYNRVDLGNLDATDWNRARKFMKDTQYQVQQVQGAEIDKVSGRRAALPTPGSSSAAPAPATPAAR